MTTAAYIIGGITLFVVGYLLGWRAGNLASIDYVLSIFMGGKPGVDLQSEVGQYTLDNVRANVDKVERRPSVRDETFDLIEEMRSRGVE